MKSSRIPLLLSSLLALSLPLPAAEPTPQSADTPPPGFDRPPGFGGPGGFGGNQPERKLVKQFDTDADKRLNAAERKAAREFLAQNLAEGRGPRGPGFRGRGQDQSPPQPGARISPADIKDHPSTSLYDLATLRTLFLDFENADWEKELADFYNTDVEVPATLTVDGKTYPDIGVHFRGNTSYMFAGEGRKRPLNLSLDFIHENQNLAGYRTLNLLNAHEDPSFLRTVLAHQIARDYFPAPLANFVRLVINGENWGVYVNVQQFNKDFARDFFGTTQGARWKVAGSPNGRGGLGYLGEDVRDYEPIYELKSKKDPKAWADLIRLCRVLEQTPSDKLEKALAPLLDVEATLKFLALDNALVNGDGFWTRASDYNLYQDVNGRFHFIPYDVNETFKGGGGGRGGPAGGPDRFGGRRGPVGPTGPSLGGPGGLGFGGPRGGGVNLDPLVAAEDATKPLISKLLAVPDLRARYLAYERDIAEKWLDWNMLGPIVQQHRALLADAIKADTRKLDTYEAFEQAVADLVPPTADDRPRAASSLRSFAGQRRAYLLDHIADQAAAPEP
jgi:hypothetical protein